MEKIVLLLLLFAAFAIVGATVPPLSASEENGVTCNSYDAAEECQRALNGTCAWGFQQSKCRKLRAIANIQDTSAPWVRDVAATQIQRDVDQFIARFETRKDLESTLNEFVETRHKGSGIRKLANWGRSAGQLLDFLPEEALGDRKAKLVEVGKKIADMLVFAHVTNHSYVEDTVMRGWPMFREPYSKQMVHEAFTSGLIGQAVAMAARAAAKSGDHATAVRFLKPVLEQIYDNFLDEDPSKIKLDNRGRYVLVPKRAPWVRRRRYLDVNDFSICLGEPSTYNDGVVAAGAAIEAMNAIQAIDWSASGIVWPLTELDLQAYELRLAAYVKKSGQWMKSAFTLQGTDHPLTGEDPARDMYPGPDGTPWYTWRYQDVSTCEDPRAPIIDPTGIRATEFLDRPQDLRKGAYEMEFVKQYMAWAQNPEIEVFDNDDVARLIVTFLNRGVHNYSASSQENLFACDIEGNISGDICTGSRYITKRSEAAPNWLVLALAAKLHGAMEQSEQVACDVYRMVRTILPITMGPGSDRFDPENFHSINSDWGADAIIAKYYFYNFDYGINKHCGAGIPDQSKPRTSKFIKNSSDAQSWIDNVLTSGDLLP